MGGAMLKLEHDIAGFVPKSAYPIRSPVTPECRFPLIKIKIIKKSLIPLPGIQWIP
jgi:hypothetical protein